nr:phospho-2-dehydro-3-deoxyheptonate aldolase [Pandoravirus belohorizontensis]
MNETTDARVPCATEPIPSPSQLAGAVPLDANGASLVADARRQVRRVLDGSDPRLLVVVGPCSAHDPVAVVEYGRRLRAFARAEVDDALLVVMRAYVEKPRTTVGWKGLASDPDLDGSCRLAEGLTTSRRLLRDLVVAVDQPVAVEFLSPLVAPYLADLVAWGAVGARTTESQVHREMASALPSTAAWRRPSMPCAPPLSRILFSGSTAKAARPPTTVPATPTGTLCCADRPADPTLAPPRSPRPSLPRRRAAWTRRRPWSSTARTTTRARTTVGRPTSRATSPVRSAAGARTSGAS